MLSRRRREKYKLAYMLRDSRDIIARLKQDGFEEVSVRGSHHKHVHRDLKRIVIVPHPRKDIPQERCAQSTGKQAGARTSPMAHYIALIHKDPDTGYGVSFPDVPGVITSGDTIDEAIQNAPDVLAFAAEDWFKQTGNSFPQPRSIDELRKDSAFERDAADAIVAAIPFAIKAEAAE